MVQDSSHQYHSMDSQMTACKALGCSLLAFVLPSTSLLLPVM